MRVTDLRVSLSATTARPWLARVLALTIAGLPATAFAQSHAQIEQVTKPQIGAMEAAKANRSPAEEKVDSNLLYAVKEARTGQINAAVPGLKANAAAQAIVTVDIRGNVTPQLLGDIASRNPNGAVHDHAL